LPDPPPLPPNRPLTDTMSILESGGTGGSREAPRAPSDAIAGMFPSLVGQIGSNRLSRNDVVAADDLMATEEIM
jgi:hypothetical protein